MPIYEYQCVENGHRFDLHQAVGAEAPACPVCGSATRKVYTSVGLIFKGSGFHVNDYPRPGASEGKPEGKADGKPEGKADGKPEGKADDKPAATVSDGGSATAAASKTRDDGAGAGTSNKASKNASDA